jgi:hypothetical protein
MAAGAQNSKIPAKTAAFIPPPVLLVGGSIAGYGIANRWPDQVTWQKIIRQKVKRPKNQKKKGGA